MELNLSDTVFAAINFVIMAGILTFLLYKPVLRVLDARKDKIEGESAQATELLEAARSSRDSSEQELLTARLEAARLLQQAASDGEVRRLSLLEEARAQSEQVYKNTKSELLLEKEKAETQLREHALSLGIHIASKIVSTAVPVSSSNRIEEFALMLSKPASLEKLRAKLREPGGRISARLEASTPLSEHERSLIRQVFAAAGVPELRFLETKNERLLGGCILYVGDLMFDGSVNTQLGNIGKEILST